MKKQRLISRLVAGSMVLLLPVLSLCGCTQQQAPDQAQVSALIEQAEGIYHPNHPALTSVENLLPFSNQDDPSDIRYYDEVEDYDQVAAQVFTDRAKQALEQAFFQEGPVLFKRDDKVYHISNAHDSMGITYFAEIVSLKQTERSGDRLTYQVTAKPAQRAESMDDPPVLGEAVTYEMVLVEQDGKLLLEEFPYPMVVSDGQIDIDRYQLVK